MGDFANPDYCADQLFAGELSRDADDRLSNLGGALEALKQALTSAQIASYRLDTAERAFQGASDESLDAFEDFKKAIETDMAAIQSKIDGIDAWDAERARDGGL